MTRASIVWRRAARATTNEAYGTTGLIRLDSERSDGRVGFGPPNWQLVNLVLLDRLPNGSQPGMVGAVGKDDSFGNENFNTTAQVDVHAKVLIGFTIIWHTSSPAILAVRVVTRLALPEV